MKLLSLGLVLLLACSCLISIKINGVKSDYEKITQAKPSIFIKGKNSTPVCDFTYSDSSKVKIGNAASIKSCLKKAQKSIVYYWHPSCQSDGCYLLEVLQNYCDGKGYELFVYAQYYHHNMAKAHGLRYPILGIDVAYYDSDRVRKYTDLFEVDLTGQAPDKEKWGRIFYFEEDRFIGQYIALEDLPT